MGGQACVLYGAAEFSRDLDLCVLAEPENLAKISTALAELHAERIAVPEFDRKHLERGHAVHFRCSGEEVAGLRIDLMSRMRGVDQFEELWNRRTTVDGEIEVLALPDLVRAKKTQRDKDWPMIRRLLEQEYFRTGERTEARIDFLLSELRTPELLVEACVSHRPAASKHERPAVQPALTGDVVATGERLLQEERAERLRDATYWVELRRELEQMRRTRRDQP